MSFASRWREYPFLKTAAFPGCLLLVLLVACARPPASRASSMPDPTLALPSATPFTATIPAATELTVTPAAGLTATPATEVTATATTELTATPAPSRTPTALSPGVWQQLPVIPDQVSERVREIYQRGLAMGEDPHVFSRIGDCASAAPDFLVGFDNGYNLGDYASLQPAIDFYKGSFKRPSLAAKAGLNSAGLLTSLWTGEQCQTNESLLDCQFRLDHPSIAFIAIGTNEAYYVHQNPGSFEHNMRIILDDTIARGIIPILGTKSDNVEGDNSINATIARLALEYQIPLWNFWLAVQPLPDHGMVEPEHLSSVSYTHFTDFSLPDSLQYGMQMRNLTALQMLDFLRQQLAGSPAGDLTPTTPIP